MKSLIAASARFPSRALAPAIPPEGRCVIKRDGTVVPWNAGKITRAVALAFHDVAHDGAPNPSRDNPAARFGVNAATLRKAQRITARVAHMLELHYRAGRHPSIEQIQDTVEMAIAAEGEWNVARAYIIYRQAHAAQRLSHYDDNGLADYIAIAKYARYRPDLFREYLFLLLAGTGCGFSVQRHHTDRLPPLPVRGEEMELEVVHHPVADTIEGWSDGLHVLLRSHWERFKVEFNFSSVRPRGSALKTSGGKAPGHLPLKQTLSDIEAVLAGAGGRRLRPIEV
jgi:hypothetical protein